jgi:transposase
VKPPSCRFQRVADGVSGSSTIRRPSGRREPYGASDIAGSRLPRQGFGDSTAYWIGELTAPTILCELGDVTRLSASRRAVRCAGLEIGVHRSDRRSRAGRLTRQGSPQLRWAL